MFRKSKLESEITVLKGKLSVAESLKDEILYYRKLVSDLQAQIFVLIGKEKEHRTTKEVIHPKMSNTDIEQIQEAANEAMKDFY